MDRKIEKKTVTPKRIAATVFVLIVAALFIYSFILKDDRSRLNVDRDRLIISTVEEGSFQEYIDITGNVQPVQTHYLDAIEGGVVQEVHLESGSRVLPGDTILVLSNSGLQLNVMQREAGIYDQINNVRNSRLNLEQNHLRLREQLASANTQLDLLKPRFERDSLLYENDLISQQEYEETEQNYRFQKMRYDLNRESYVKDSLQLVNQMDQLNRSEERMWRSLEGVQQILDNLIITSPIDGQLSTVELSQGQSIEKGERIGQIDVLDGYKVRARIDEFYLPRVVSGLEGSFSYAGQEYNLRITRLFPVIQDGQFEVDMEFTGEMPDDLTRGQSVRIRLELGDSSQAMLLPRGGFYQSTGGNWVFVLNEDETRAYRQPVRLGRGNPQFFEVLEGLGTGDKVVTSGYDAFGNNEVLMLE